MGAVLSTICRDRRRTVQIYKLMLGVGILNFATAVFLYMILSNDCGERTPLSNQETDTYSTTDQSTDRVGRNVGKKASLQIAVGYSSPFSKSHHKFGCRYRHKFGCRCVSSPGNVFIHNLFSLSLPSNAQQRTFFILFLDSFLSDRCVRIW